MTELIELIDIEIDKLQTARNVLARPEPTPPAALQTVIVKDVVHNPRLSIVKQRGMSPEGRARVAAAQKLRWAKEHAKKRKASKAA